MLKTTFILSAIAAVLFISCTKEKTPTPPTSLITAECPDTIKFSSQILPMITDNCLGCHNTGGSANPVINSYTSINLQADKILKCMKGELQLMPQGGPALADSLIQQFSCWIFQGKMDN